MKKSFVYIITNKNNTVLYTGVTSDIAKRMFQHKTKFYKGFSARYNCDKLVYFEEFSFIRKAIEREKQIKKYKRFKKISLIEKVNPDWNDFSNGWDFMNSKTNF